LVRVLCALGAEVELLDSSAAPLDIWIRDWGCVEGVFFRYAPDYAKGLYSRAAVIRAQSALGARLRVPCRAVPLVLDGGNLVHNGTVAIVTKKVFRDNAHLSRSEIERMIGSLGFERVVFIPNEPGDEIGHSDGMCRFVSKRTLLVNDYDITSMRSFGRQLRQVLYAAKLDAELVPLPWFCHDGRGDGVPSAIGCYMNFLQIAQGVIRAATNAQQWYVSISRGRKSVRIFTPDKAQLRTNVARSGDRPLAMDLKPPRNRREALRHILLHGARCGRALARAICLAFTAKRRGTTNTLKPSITP
jgi:hypothetical protein